MKRVGLAILVTATAALLLALAQGAPTDGTVQPAVGKRPWQRGDQYLYQHFFAQVTRINRQAEDAERLGMNSQYLRNYYQREAQLYESQATLLNETAAALAAELAEYDAKASEARKRWHVLVQTKRQNHEQIPPAPAEMRQLQAGREALILQARDRLRAGLGEAEFNRLDAYVRGHAPSRQPGSGNSQSTNAAASSDRVKSDRGYYLALFRSVAYLKQKAAQEAELGLPELADGLRTMIQRRAGLTEQEMRVLDEVATQDLQDRAKWVAQLKMARLPSQRITLEMLAREGTIARTSELAAAQAPVRAVMAQMDALTDSSIRRLREALGEEGFARLDGYAKRGTKAPPARITNGGSEGVTR